MRLLPCSLIQWPCRGRIQITPFKSFGTLLSAYHAFTACLRSTTPTDPVLFES